MLCNNAYSPDYVAAARAHIAASVDAFRAIDTAADGDPALRDAVDAFEPTFFNALVLALDGHFTHRGRTVEGKDGNPANEVRLLCTSLTENGGVLVADKGIKLRAADSVLGLEPGDPIAVRADGFVRLADGFFAVIEERFTAAVPA
jgi:hypothetical protein